MKEETGKTQVRGTIKPLEWEINAIGPDTAQTPWGRYAVRQNLDRWAWCRNGDLYLYESEDAAKAAAQADYEARILAQIDPAPEVQPVTWVSVERKFYHSEWSLSKLLEARNGGLLTDNGEAWTYRYSHKDGVGGKYDMLVRREAPCASKTAARAENAEAEIEQLRALMRRAHTLMLECGWHLAPGSDLASGDGVLEAAVAEVEDEFRAALERKEGT